MNNVLVSIIVPCYNQAQFIGETLDSVLNQKYPTWECIIVDDGSTDNTEAVVETYLRRDKRFSYFKKTNSGVANTRNYGIQQSKGEFILPLDGDDKISDDYLELAVPILCANTNVRFVYCNAEYFGMKSGRWNLSDYKYSKFIYKNMIFCTGLYRRSDFNKTKGYDPQLVKGLEDWDFLLSLISENDIVYKINKTCFFYRIQEKSRTKNLTKTEIIELYNQIYRNHAELYDTHIVENPLYLKYTLECLEEKIEQLKKQRSITSKIIDRCVRSYKKITNSIHNR